MSDSSIEAPAAALAVERVTVIGAGTMGRGIAQVAAGAGLTVVLCDVDRGALDRARAAIDATLAKGVALGKSTAEAHAATLARLSLEPDLARASAAADVVIEAVPEDLALKRRLFATVIAAAGPRTLLASNTSALPIGDLVVADGAGEAATARARLVGMHFFNPVHLMKLVEVVHHAGTAPAALAAATGLAARLGKTAIVVRDAPGFASSRLGIALGLEAMRMVEEEVASAADIDTAMKLGYGHPMGPLELTDLVGLDVRLAIADHLAAALGPRYQAPALLRRMVADGALGKKSGQGFYRWVDGKRAD